MRLTFVLSGLLAMACLGFTGCAKTGIKQVYKSPSYSGGPFQKIAIISVDNRGMVRQGFENRFFHAFKANGQESIVTHELMSLEEMKADKVAAGKALKEAGADAVLITRLVDQATYSRQVNTGERYAAVTTGMDYSYGWYGYYSVAFMDMSTTWSNTKQEVFLDSTLYSLKDGQRTWSALTKTTVKETTDRLVEADELTAKVANAMRRDGVAK
jgi:hypothetical protein